MYCTVLSRCMDLAPSCVAPGLNHSLLGSGQVTLSSVVSHTDLMHSDADLYVTFLQVIRYVSVMWRPFLGRAKTSRSN